MARILAVDDSGLDRAVLLDALRALGHTTVMVDSGEAALERFAAGCFDVVLTDFIMPGIDGLALARKLSLLQPSLPIGLITGAESPATDVLAGYPCLRKPYDVDGLGKFVDDVVARRIAGEGTDPWSGEEFLSRVGGSAERFPPPRVLFLAHRLRASGSLRVERGGATVRLGLRSGKLVEAAGVPGLLATLDRDIPDPPTLGAALATAVRAGHSPDRVLEAVSDGIGAWIGATANLRDGTVAFEPGWRAPPGSFPLPDPLLRIVSKGLTRARSDALVARTWAALDSAAVSLRLPNDAPEETWGLDPTATRVVRLAGRAETVARLLELAGGAEPSRKVEVLRAMDTLRILGLLLVDGGAISVTPPVVSGVIHDATQEDARAGRLMRALETLERDHPVDALELGSRLALTEAEVSNAYRAISRRYHPDVYFNAPPAVRSLAEACFAKVNDAHELLRRPGGVAEARRFIAARARGENFVSEKEQLAARVAFRRGEALFRGRDFAGADVLFLEAVRLAPGVWPYPLHAAYSGWLAHRLLAAEALVQLEALSPAEPARQAEVDVLMGNVLKQEARTEEATRRYRQALERDPTNRDAAREVRLHDMRNPRPPSSGKKA